jgi:hypothetical protein
MRTAFIVVLHLTLSLSPLMALLRRDLFDQGDGRRNARRSAMRSRVATPPHADGNRFPPAGHLRIARIGWTILQVNFVCAVSVPVGGAHEETFKGYGT